MVISLSKKRYFLCPGVTYIDFLVKGDKDQRAKESLKDTELLALFKAVEQMGTKDQAVVKALIDAFITKKKVQQLAL